MKFVFLNKEYTIEISSEGYFILFSLLTRLSTKINRQVAEIGIKSYVHQLIESEDVLAKFYSEIVNHQPLLDDLIKALLTEANMHINDQLKYRSDYFQFDISRFSLRRK